MDLLSQLDELKQVLLACNGRVKYSGLNSISHINKAFALVETDPNMAAFRAICAEEEAATALISSIQANKYPQSEKIQFRNHATKAAVIVFLQAVIDWMTARLDMASDRLGKPLLQFTDEPGRKAIEVLIPLVGLTLAVHPRPPLGLQSQGGRAIQDMIGDTVKLNLRKNLDSEIKGEISITTKLRNDLLYASDSSLPMEKSECETFLLDKASNVAALLTAIGMIDPWGPPLHPLANIVSAAVLEFVRVMSSNNKN